MLSLLRRHIIDTLEIGIEPDMLAEPQERQGKQKDENEYAFLIFHAVVGP